MGFAIETVDDCPVTRGSQGVLTMTVDQIAMIAGAVRDKIEWMVLLHGTRSDDGYEVKVDRFTVPLQYRGSTEVELARDIVLPADCVGVMHSHHSMGAFFSHTDDTELNPRFPSSIVVAISNNNLGFKYEACGKVKLPCGAMGLVDFELAVEGVERFAAEAVRGQHDAEKVADLKATDGGLKGCTHRQYITLESDNYLAIEATQCGLSAGEVREKPLVFGMDGAELLKAVQDMTEKPLSRQLPAHYQGNGGGTGSTYNLSKYWADKKAEEDERRAALGNGKGKGRKGKKGKNGLVKLERPESGTLIKEANSGRRYINGNCDDCGWLDRLYWQAEVQDWLCDHCTKKITEAIEATNSNDDRSVVVTDQVDMSEVTSWGV